jgi:hypothetical protein
MMLAVLQSQDCQTPGCCWCCCWFFCYQPAQLLPDCHQQLLTAAGVLLLLLQMARCWKPC